MKRLRLFLSLVLIGLLSSVTDVQSKWHIEYSDNGVINILSEDFTTKGKILLNSFNKLKSNNESIDCAPGEENIFCRDLGFMKIGVRQEPYCEHLVITINEGEDVGPGNSITYERKYDGHLYGGSEQRKQFWPLDDVVLNDYSYITKEDDSQAIAERYWLTSSGQIFYVEPEASLFLYQNVEKGTLGFHCENKAPYPTPRPLICALSMCGFENAKEAHMFAIENFLDKPSDIPDEEMVKYPIWSTWARYKRDITEETVLAFASDIIDNGFKNSQIEIDDLWETCYGSFTFDKNKFPNMKGLTDSLKEKGFRVTLWVHTFINLDCEEYYNEAKEKGYLAQNTEGSLITSWWNGENGIATVIDFTNPDAAKWWTDRLWSMMEENGIDSLKFDAGESSWMPQVPKFPADVDVNLQPNIYTQKFVETVAPFGKMAEIRTGFQTQKYPNFVRMIDKDTKWDFENGLSTLVTTLIQMNLAGYPFVLPDMVGGNGYGEDGSIGSGGVDNAPSKELFIRWLQANVFMPAIQYSFVPWEYDPETTKICKYFTELHEAYADKIIAAMKKAVESGTPVNPPIWWIAPTDEDALTVNDEFLLGEDILVAPVMEHNALQRDIYLPAGSWLDKIKNQKIEGPIWLRNYPVALDQLAYFELGGEPSASTQLTIQTICLLMCLLAACLNCW